VDPNPVLLRPFSGLFCQPWMIDGNDCVAVRGVNEICLNKLRIIFSYFSIAKTNWLLMFKKIISVPRITPTHK
jgi:hypothetical protein